MPQNNPKCFDVIRRKTCTAAIVRALEVHFI